MTRKINKTTGTGPLIKSIIDIDTGGPSDDVIPVNDNNPVAEALRKLGANGGKLKEASTTKPAGTTGKTSIVRRPKKK